MRRRRPAVEALALHASHMALATAVESLPIDKFAFNKARYRWVKVVRGHPMLTAAQRQVGLAIAQEHINHNPENPWFHTAWASHKKIAKEIGVSRRTVISAMVALRQMGLIAIEHGGGWKVPGGRTDRYTLRTDWLDVLDRAAQIVRQKDVKIFHRSNRGEGSQFDESREKNGESGEIIAEMMGNSPNKDVKGLRTTLYNTTPLESSLSTYLEPLAPSDARPLTSAPQASNGRNSPGSSINATRNGKLLGIGSSSSLLSAIMCSTCRTVCGF
jgi:Bacterial regulatory proteins, gntR family